METLRDRVRGFVFTGCTPEQLAIVRIALGVGLVGFHYLQFKHFRKLDFDGPAFHFLSPIWYFDLLGIDAVPAAVALAALAVLMLASLSFGIGFFTRSSLVVALVMILLLKGARDSVAGDVHHRYLIPFNIFLFLLLSRAGDVWSIDAWRKRRRGVVIRLQEWEASWPIRSAQIYVAAFYFVSAVAKLRMSGWAWGSAERIQSLLLKRSVRFGLNDGTPVDGSHWAYMLSQNEFLCGVIGASTFVFEFGFPLVLIIRSNWIRLLFLSGVAFFHIANYYLVNVQFLLLPIVFVIFFDLSKPIQAWLGRRVVTSPEVAQ